MPGTVTISGKPSLDIDPKTKKSIRRQAGLPWYPGGRIRCANLIEKTATGYGAHIPDPPGCVAARDTLEETGALDREAIAFHFEGMRLHREPLPGSASMSEYVEVAIPAQAPGTGSPRPSGR